MTKSGTGTWELGREDSGTPGRGTRGRGDARTRGRGNVELGEAGTRIRDKQTTPEFCAEFSITIFGGQEKGIL